MEILVAIHGQSVQENAPGYRRAILARVELTTQEEPYQWLNTCFLVGEGEIDEEREVWWLTTYVCVNDTGPASDWRGTARAIPSAGRDAGSRQGTFLNTGAGDGSSGWSASDGTTIASDDRRADAERRVA
jgi:hypothetical protein